MTLSEFKVADRSLQYDIICDHGIRLISRDFSDYSVILYQVEGFYVEVVYEGLEGRIGIFRAFNTTLLLDPYLEQIDISFLTNV